MNNLSTSPRAISSASQTRAMAISMHQTDMRGQLGEHIITLSRDEANTIRAAIDTLPRQLDPHKIDIELLNQVELLQYALPERLKRALLTFRRTPNRAGTLIIKNMPTDPELPATPADGRPAKDKASSYSEYGLMMSMLFLGEPIAYMDEKEGALIQNICPVKGKEMKQENTGSSYLEFHVEDGFHPYKPDYLALTCLRSDHDGVAKTTSASIRNVVHLLPSAALALLREPLYRLRLSPSFSDSETPMYSDMMPVLSGHLLDPDMCIDYYLMEASTKQAQWALELLKQYLLGAVLEYSLQPGDLMILDNRMAAHGRTHFTPRYDGSDRWLQRMFVVRDLRKSAASRGIGSHVCAPLDVELFQ